MRSNHSVFFQFSLRLNLHYLSLFLLLELLHRIGSYVHVGTHAKHPFVQSLHSNKHTHKHRPGCPAKSVW